MTEILVFGGTLEGRELAEWLSARGTCQVVACSATEFGGELVSGLPGVEALVGPLGADAKERLVSEHDFACIVDATHPYAVHVSQSLVELAQKHGLPLIRLIRERDDLVQSAASNTAALGTADSSIVNSGGAGNRVDTSDTSTADASDANSTASTVNDVDVRACPVVVVPDVSAAAEYVAHCTGKILLTTGSKDLGTFTGAMSDFAERLYARVLPVVDSVVHAHELGIPAGHIVAMRGPFSTDFNCALMRELGINIMVTKASGAAGGFPEKMEAAAQCGVQAVVIDRPTDEEGLTFAEVRKTLTDRFGV